MFHFRSAFFRSVFHLSINRGSPFDEHHQCQPAIWVSSMKPAIAYIRVSTEEQATEGVSLNAQRSRVEAWCVVNDFQLAGVFVDAGISGKRADNRPELQNALTAVTKTKGVLVVYSLSRLARSTKDTIAISERLNRANADLVSLSEKIDTTSAAGKMVFQMLAVLAEFERNQISERTKAAMSHMREQGRFLGEVPFGYDLRADGETLIENPGELETIALIKSLREKGYSLQGIAKELHALKISTKRGKLWAPQTVSNVLNRSA